MYQNNFIMMQFTKLIFETYILINHNAKYSIIRKITGRKKFKSLEQSERGQHYYTTYEHSLQKS